MNLITTLAVSQNDTASRPAEEFLVATGLTRELPLLLIQADAGRLFEPAQLQLSQAPAQLTAQLALLRQPEPLGGFEPLLQRNSRLIEPEARIRLQQRLAARGRALPTRSLLTEIQAALRQLMHDFAAELDQVDRSALHVMQQIQRWQEQNTRREGGGLLGEIWRLMLGTSEVPLLQVLNWWNERERLFVRQSALREARGLVGRLVDSIGQLVDQLEALSDQARQRQRELRQQVNNAVSAAQPTRLLTLQVNNERVATRIMDTTDVEALLSPLLAALAAQGWQNLAGVTASIACQEAERQLENFDLYRLLELDGAAVAGDSDVLLAIGQGLVEALDLQTTWQLIGSARPRVETLQVTPDGQPLFALDGLSSAAFGTPGDQLGFVQVQLDLAPDELRLIADGERAFVEAQQIRNFYAIEELAQAWEEQHAAPSHDHKATLHDPEPQLTPEQNGSAWREVTA